MRVTVKISDQNIKDIETQLDGIRKPQSAIKTAINNTSKKVQRNLANKASKQYTGPIARQGTILAKSEIKMASAAGQEATIRFKSPVHEPRNFHVVGVSLDSGKIVGRKYTKTGKAAKIKNRYTKRLYKGSKRSIPCSVQKRSCSNSQTTPSNRTLSGTTTAATPVVFSMERICWTKFNCLLLVVAQKSWRL